MKGSNKEWKKMRKKEVIKKIVYWTNMTIDEIGQKSRGKKMFMILKFFNKIKVQKLIQNVDKNFFFSYLKIYSRYAWIRQ